jgi:exodeoxyribonuclease VII large subunit
MDKDNNELIQYSSIQKLLTSLNNQIKQQFKLIKLNCEVNQIKEYPYCVYVVIKDDSGTIKGIISKKNYCYSLSDGDKLCLIGELGVYKSDVQLSIKQYDIIGIGDVHTKFIKLKKMYETKGYFDIIKKRTVHNRYDKIGVVTSLKAAGFKDMMETFYHRMVGGEIVIYPATVQGKDAPQQVANAIGLANRHQYVQLIIIARGGGSKEDLECFNDPIIIDAVYSSKIPTATGIGHQIDESIADLVCDRSFITPTASAQGTTIDRKQLLHKLGEMKYELLIKLSHVVKFYSSKLTYYQQIFTDKINNQIDNHHVVINNYYTNIENKLIYNFKKNQLLIANYHQKLLSSSLILDFEHYKHQCETNDQKLKQYLLTKQNTLLNKLENYQQQINTYQTIFDQGYAQIFSNNKIIKSKQEFMGLNRETTIVIKFNDGDIKLTVKLED